MFCPVCKSEYRQGFTECSDCGVPLVETLHDAAAASSKPVDPQTAVLLWSGTSAQSSAAIGRALDDAHVAHHDTAKNVGPLPGLTTAVYAIFVHQRDHDAARAALESARLQLEAAPQEGDEADEPDDRGSIGAGAGHSEEAEEPLAPTNYVPEDFDPEDATSEVWSGSDRRTAEGLAMCLRENGIGSAVSHQNAVARISVLPGDELRAREIVREVVEASSPE
jgi:hypothetical protein